VDRRLRSFKRACADRRFTVCEVAGGDAALARLLHRELRRRNLTVGGGVELSLLENSPAARSLLGELEKLENHAAPGRHSGMEDIAAVHCGGGTDNFFSIGDAFFCRDTAGLADKLRQFFSAGGEPRALLASLLGNCRLLLQLHALGGSGGGCPTARRAMDSVRRRQFSEISPGEGWKSPVEKNAFLRRRLAPHLPRWTVGELRSLQVAIGQRFEEWIAGGGEAGWWEDELLALALKFPAEEKNSPDRGDGKW
jgi:hypothetical protein